jgi:D-sedoheptulose 7-phosphate isomerase
MTTARLGTADMQLIAVKELEDSIDTKEKLKAHTKQIAAIAQAMIRTLSAGGKIVMFGNGGSAADAQHLVAELVGQFGQTRKGLPALALTVNSSVLTAISNDFSYEEVFARQVEALVSPGDLVVGISTGGGSNTARTSRNVVRGIEEAKKQGAVTVGLLGKGGGVLKDMVDFPLVIPSNNTQRIQEAHITVGHILCSLVERGLAG